VNARAQAHRLFEEHYLRPLLAPAAKRTATFRPLPADPLTWLRQTFGSFFQNARGEVVPLAPHHEEFWRWLWQLRPGQAAPSFIGLWARGAGKSTSCELAIAAAGYFGLRRYALYCCQTQQQADDHVASIAHAFELLGVERAVNKYGFSRGWRVNACGPPRAIRSMRSALMPPYAACGWKRRGRT
jgi:hypothetical protein